MSINLSPLPYDVSALEPYISKATVDYHFNQHHKNYVTTLNELIVGTNYEHMSLAEIMMATTEKIQYPFEEKILNNAGQVWNHTFFWKCLSRTHNTIPSPKLQASLEANFGSVQCFMDEFTIAAQNLFGSGWIWLVKTPEQKLEIITTENAGNPMLDGKLPILVCDLWEHSYYLDYQNRREQYINNFFRLIDWTFVEQGLD